MIRELYYRIRVYFFARRLAKQLGELSKMIKDWNETNETLRR